MDQSRLYSFYEQDPNVVVGFIEYLRESYGLPSHGALLDMGCGPGRMLVPFAQAEWVVTGFEPDPEYAVSASDEVSEVEGATVRQGGFLNLRETEAYDLIAAVNGPYSYLLTHGERREALKRCWSGLRPGGVLFLEFSNFLWILRNYQKPQPQLVQIDGVEVTRDAEHLIDYHDGTFTHVDTFSWMESGRDCAASKTHRMAIVSASEVLYFLEDLGFEDIRTFNSLRDRAPSSLAARKIVVTARRGRNAR